MMKELQIKILREAVDIVELRYPSVSTAFLCENLLGCSENFIEIIILLENYHYCSFESFRHADYAVSVLIFPQSYISLTDRQFDFAENYNFFSKLSKGFLIKDMRNRGESLQQAFEAVKGLVADAYESSELGALRHKITLDLDLFGLIDSKLRKNVIKSEIFCNFGKIMESSLFSRDSYIKYMSLLSDNFNDDLLFHISAKKMLNELNLGKHFYTPARIGNYTGQQSISVLLTQDISLDGFISEVFLVIMGKLKKITSAIRFSFRLYERHKYLLTIWSSEKIIRESVIPSLDMLFYTDSNYEHFNPKYPFYDRLVSLREVILGAVASQKIQQTITHHLLDLKLNEGMVLSEGYLLSVGIHITLEIFILSERDRDSIKKISNDLCEKWLSLACETQGTNIKDLDYQTFKILKEFEELYRIQESALSKNYGMLIKSWNFDGCSIDGLDVVLEAAGENLGKQRQELGKDLIFGRSKFLECFLQEVHSSLGITNYYKSYIAYCINRMLHEN